jgi:uncharacterized protein
LSARYVYLHGFASGPTSSKAQYFRRKLAEEGFLLEVPELVEGPFERLTLTGQLEVVSRVVQGEPVVLIGSSMGGYLASLFAARNPNVERLLLLAPAFGMARRWLDTLPPGEAEAWRTSGYHRFYHYVFGRELDVGYQLIEDGLTYEDYPDVRQPTLIFHGRHDDVVPYTLSVEFAASRPNARLLLMDSDHQLTGVLDAIWAEARPFLLAGVAPSRSL